MSPCSCSEHGYTHHHAFGRTFACEGDCAYCRVGKHVAEGEVELVDADANGHGGA